jgi:hypothetical protein
VALVAVLAACSTGGQVPASGGSPSATSDESQPHTHGPGHEHISSLVGDGTRDSEIGYTLTRVALPKAAGAPGTVRFQIKTNDGPPLRDYIPQQTKDLHLYLVRTDLAIFRHLHPTLDQTGTWSAPVTLPEPGDYRVIAEFIARDQGGNGAFLMLGKTATVPGTWSSGPVAPPEIGSDGVVNVDIDGDVEVGTAGRMGVLARDTQGRPVKLGTYLGSFAHVTAFHVESGSVIHLHPLGQPGVDEDGTRLSFHTEFEKPGEYLCFVQIRVDGFLHSLPVGVKVS